MHLTCFQVCTDPLQERVCRHRQNQGREHGGQELQEHQPQDLHQSQEERTIRQADRRNNPQKLTMMLNSIIKQNIPL